MDESLKWTTSKLSFVQEDGEKRLNASAYSSNAIKALNLLESLTKSQKHEKLSKLTKEIFVGGRVKRLFTSKEKGIPYLLPTNMFEFDLSPIKWVRKETKDIENWQVTPFTILITQSGTPGRSILANKLFVGSLISPNVIRVKPLGKDFEMQCYLYAYLNTWVAQTILTKNKYGSSIKHIDPKYIGELDVPLIPTLINKVSKQIFQVYKLREDAQILLREAIQSLYTELKLDVINEDEITYLNGDVGREVNATYINTIDSTFRLDASYYNPVISAIRANLDKNKNGHITRLGDLTDFWVPARFKRIYVQNKIKGVPFLQGSHISKIRFFDVKYLWEGLKNMDELRLKSGDILLSGSGTIGRICLTSVYLENFAGSNHLVRIRKKTSIDTGYLIAFLLSEYGQVQFKRLIYGGVVDEIGEAGNLLNDILILKPTSEETEKKIGSFIITAYEKRDLANKIEAETIEYFENELLKFTQKSS